MHDLIRLGYTVTFNRFTLYLQIHLERGEHKFQQWLPLSDHFKEEKIVNCLSFMEKQFPE